MTEAQAELEYLRYLFENIDLGEDADEKKYFLNAQYRASGNYVPKQYDIYMKD